MLLNVSYEKHEYISFRGGDINGFQDFRTLRTGLACMGMPTSRDFMFKTILQNYIIIISKSFRTIYLTIYLSNVKSYQ